ncbi:MAG TPA: type II toxin-antitoxin system VapC family toxin [Thermoanaerobaculia bacterium]|jgi:predicted nucleic acid-binding protein|nr:type II toxin-antitoxin system VapC family toxin [Thermoanaerobaculia bacterium]
MIPLYAVDSMLFVYHFENNERFGPVAGRLLAAAEAGRCRLVASVLARLEVLVVPKRHGREDLCQRYRDLFDSFPNLTVLPIGPEIAEIAAGLRATHSIRTPDALHLATAIHGGAKAFVSEDRRLKKVEGIEVMELAEASIPV